MNGLLVSGSRSLPDAALDAVHNILRDLVSCEGNLSLIVGDTQGPDTVAQRVAERARKGSACFGLDGKVFASIPTDGGGWKYDKWSWWQASDPRPSPQRWPLARNRAMVEALQLMVAEDRVLAKIAGEEPRLRVLCVGFVDPQSRTHGTDHTLRLARQAGIWTARYVWTGESFEEQS